MTKQEFLSGKLFRVSNLRGNSFQFVAHEGHSEGSIQRNIMSGDEIILFDHEGNVSKIGSKTFEMYTFVMNKKVKLKYRFDELI
jgi:hypothetical protein